MTAKEITGNERQGFVTNTLEIHIESENGIRKLSSRGNKAFGHISDRYAT